MNKDLKKYKELKDKTFTTSEVIKGSFVNVIKQLEKEDYVIIENQRKKKTMILQDIDTVTGVKISIRDRGDSKIEENKLFARSRIKENTYFLMRFESKNITFPDIETILNSPTSTKLGFDATITKQLMDGWKFIIDNPKPLDFQMFLDINAIVAYNQALEWGKLRTGKVTISGTTYVPSVPSTKQFKNYFEEFKSSKDFKKAISILLLRLIKNQPFWDGNKRTAFLAVNKFMLEKGKGLIVLNDKLFEEFNKLLNNYYEHDDQKSIIEFIIKNMFVDVPKK